MIWKIIIYGHKEIWFSRASRNDSMIGQNRGVFEVIFWTIREFPRSSSVEGQKTCAVVG
jgi:hypothetical protein